MALAPVTVHGPVDPARAIALVCDSPHSGAAYPADFGHAVARAALRQSEDTDVDRLWAGVPSVGGTLLCATFPRSYIDTNRDEADIDVSMIGEPWPRPVRPSARCLDLGIGLIWRETPERLPIYARKLAAQEVSLRLDNYWRPYRQTLAQQLEQAARRWGGYWHLNLHSMPGNAYERLGLPASRPLADVVLGDRRGTTCGPQFRDLVVQAFRDGGYSVAINDPYEGAELVRIAGAPALGRHSLQVEINRALYMDERTREPAAGFQRLQAGIGQVLKAIAAHVRAQAADAIPPGVTP